MKNYSHHKRWISDHIIELRIREIQVGQMVLFPPCAL